MVGNVNLIIFFIDKINLYWSFYFEEREGKMRKRTHKKNFWFNDEEENRIKELCNKSGMNESDIVRNLIMVRC